MHLFIASLLSILFLSHQYKTHPIIYPIGANVHLQCPVQTPTNELLFFEWFTNHQPIQESHRIRVTLSGVLKIKSALEEDTGSYQCKAITGFGTLTANLSLRVVASDKLPSLQSPLADNLFPVDSSQRPKNSIPLYRKSVGSPFIYNCDSPKKRIRWLKNGHHIGVRHLPKGSRISGPQLTISSLRVEDSGNYSCSDRQLNESFRLVVFVDQKPEFRGFNPANRSVFVGERTVFHCQIFSQLKPHIQWLKACEDVESAEEAINKGLMTIGGRFYKVIRSQAVVDDRGDRHYFNNLVLERTQLSDTGEYICLVADTNFGQFSIHYKSSYLRVIERNEDHSSSVKVGTTVKLFWLTIAFITGFVVILIALLVLRSMNGQNNR